MQALVTNLLLPPLVLVLTGMFAGLLAWHGWRKAGLLAALAASLVLLLATPFASDFLLSSLERTVSMDPVPTGSNHGLPRAIIVLGAEAVQTAAGLEVGSLTLERLRAGAALQRRTGLPLLVTAGPLAPNQPPLGPVMAHSLAVDFGITTRWVESRARDTHENAVFSTAMLKEADVGAAYLVTHGWHMPRAQASFARLDFTTIAAPVHLAAPSTPGIAIDWVPRPDYLAISWFALREWVGQLVYAVRD